MPFFGETQEEFEARMSNQEVWIRKFPKGRTKVRFLTPASKWARFREHSHPVIGSFPCPMQRWCPGCADPVERISKRPRMWASNALDAKGNLRIFKVGKDLYDAFVRDEQNYGPVTERDYEVLRTGEMLETVYERERLDKYEIKPEDIPPLHDIGDILDKQLQKACDYYGIAWGEVPEQSQSQDTPETVPDPTPEPAADQDDPDLPMEKWNSARLRKFLGEHNVEAPQSASRTVLVKYAQRAVEATKQSA